MKEQQEALNVDHVFGVVRDVPLNYVSRKTVDEALVESLSRDKHIVLHGGSKQGKTCLRKHCLDEGDYIVVQCSDRWSIADINTNVLKRAGFEITVSEERAASGRYKIFAKLSAKMFGSGISAGADSEVTETERSVTAPMELDPTDVNDLIAALDNIKFKRFIVLEDFHYLDPDVQRQFAIELKALHETSDYCVIVVGVWLEENRLIVYNGDLTGRIIPINADKWTTAELKSVIESGEKLLKIKFDEEFIEELCDRCFESVSIVQECCRKACREAGVFATQASVTRITAPKNVETLIKEVVDQQRGRYHAFITNFADGFKETQFEMYRWLLFPILTSDAKTLEEGLTYAEIRRNLQDNHPNKGDLNPGNITQALKSATSLQIQKNIKPIVLDYDATTRRLTVVDRGFLIWLANQSQQEVLEIAALA